MDLALSRTSRQSSETITTEILGLALTTSWWLFVSQRLGGCDSRRCTSRQIRGQQRRHVGQDQDPRDLHDGYMEKGLAAKSIELGNTIGDQEPVRPPNSDGGANGQAHYRDQARLHQERALDQRAPVAQGPQHADLLPSLDHRPG